MTGIRWLAATKYPTIATKRAYDVVLGKMLQPAPTSTTDRETPYLNSASVQRSGILANREQTMWASAMEARDLSVNRGDLLVCEGGDVGRASLYNGPSGFIFQNSVHRVRAFNGSDVRYFHYVLEALRGSEWLDVLCNKATIRHFTSEKLGNLRIPHPPLEEQRRIADFLDAETNRSDRLIKAYEAARTTLVERVQYFIDMNIQKAGNLVPLKYFVRFREGPGIMAADFRDEGIPLVRLSGLKDGLVTLDGANYLDNSDVLRRWSRFRLQFGDYLISGSATMGAVSVVKTHDAVGAIPYTGLIILRPAMPSVVMEYVGAALTSTLFMRQIDLLKAGATMQHFGPTHLAQILLPFPSRERQIEMAAAFRELQEHFVATTKAVGRQIAVLAERRQALITAAVTGQIDVTAARRIPTSGGGG